MKNIIATTYTLTCESTSADLGGGDDMSDERIIPNPYHLTSVPTKMSKWRE